MPSISFFLLLVPFETEQGKVAKVESIIIRVRDDVRENVTLSELSLTCLSPDKQRLFRRNVTL